MKRQAMKPEDVPDAWKLSTVVAEALILAKRPKDRTKAEVRDLQKIARKAKRLER